MERPPRNPFDQGLFLAHFNKGREAYEAQRFAEAERELEEAYLLRPREPRVLNLLGLAYFKQERFDRAEEVYRKLVAESPEAHTLHYNLGLICFKLERLDEAETAFLKALELAGENPKIRFYLGSIYERLRRFHDAIYQYRQAGAHILVRRVEDKLAAAPAKPGVPAAGAGSTAKPAAAVPAVTLPPAGPPAVHAETLPPRPDLTVPPIAAPPRPAGDSDTSRLRVEDVRAALSTVPAQAGPAADELPANVEVQPVGRPLLADDAPKPTEDTARFRLQLEATQPRPPAEGRQIFHMLDHALLEVEVRERVFIRPGTLYSYSGSFTFWVKERRPGGHPALAIATGRGRLLLRDRERQVTFLRVEGEPLTVAPDHLLACEASLVPRFAAAEGDASDDFLVLEGHGLVALSMVRKPLALAVAPALPVAVPAASLISWSGALRAVRVDDPQLYEAAGGGGRPAGAWMRFEGQGRVLVEQPAP